MKRSLGMFVAVATLALLSACSKAQDRGLPGGDVDSNGRVHLSPTRPTVPGGGHTSREALGPIEAQLFPPDLIIENQTAIGLEPTQRDAIDAEVKKADAELVDLQWKLQAEKEALVSVLSTDSVDTTKARDAAERVMAKEHDVKAANLAMLVRIKNALTPAQESKLRKIRDDERCAPAAQ